jgi:hypothetical protein
MRLCLSQRCEKSGRQLTGIPALDECARFCPRSAGPIALGRSRGLDWKKFVLGMAKTDQLTRSENYVTSGMCRVIAPSAPNARHKQVSVEQEKA